MSEMTQRESLRRKKALTHIFTDWHTHSHFGICLLNLSSAFGVMIRHKLILDHLSLSISHTFSITLLSLKHTHSHARTCLASSAAIFFKFHSIVDLSDSIKSSRLGPPAPVYFFSDVFVFVFTCLLFAHAAANICHFSNMTHGNHHNALSVKL